MNIWRSGRRIIRRSPPFDPNADSETFAPPPGYNDVVEHQANFFNAVRSRKKTVENEEFGNNAAIGCHLANYSYFNKRRRFGTRRAGRSPARRLIACSPRFASQIDANRARSPTDRWTRLAAHFECYRRSYR